MMQIKTGENEANKNKAKESVGFSSGNGIVLGGKGSGLFMLLPR